MRVEEAALEPLGLEGLLVLELVAAEAVQQAAATWDSVVRRQESVAAVSNPSPERPALKAER